MHGRSKLYSPEPWELWTVSALNITLYHRVINKTKATTLSTRPMCLPLNRKQVFCWGIFLSMLRLITSSYSFQSIAVRLKTSQIQIRVNRKKFSTKGVTDEKHVIVVGWRALPGCLCLFALMCSTLAMQLSQCYLRKDDDTDDGQKKTDGHPHSHTCSRLRLRFVSLMMMRGYRKVRGCENSKVTWYPRQPLPTSAKLVVVQNFRAYSHASSPVMLS